MKKQSDRYKLLKISEKARVNIEEFSSYYIPKSYYQANKNGEIGKIVIDNDINEFPLGLDEFENLKHIDLSNNNIKEIPKYILNIKNNIIINLSNNAIESISEEILLSDFVLQIGSYRKYRKGAGYKIIILNNNPIFYPPIEILSKGKNSIKNYLKEKEKGIDFLYELKVLFVGEGRVGKTSLMKSLVDPEYILEDTQSTEGININSLLIKKEEFKPIISSEMYNALKKNFHVNLWDFGGQEIYHTTHQFFLTKRSLYLLVTESRKEDKPEDFYYWLNIINLLGGNSPIILVLNKYDQPSKEIPLNEYKSIFPQIIGSVEKVSCIPEYKSSITSLKHNLMRTITNSNLLPHIGTPLPRVWIMIREDLKTQKLSGKNYISLKDYIEICKTRFKENESEEEEKENYNERALKLAEYFHDLGVLLYFQNDFWLRDIVFLNNDWVTKAVYKILDNPNVKMNKGFFSEKDVLRIWSDDEFNETRRELLALMKNKQFDICFEVNPGEYLAPQLFQVDKPIVSELDKFDQQFKEDGLYFSYHYHFKPKGILSRFIVKLHFYIHNRIYWRYGLLLNYGDTKALITEPPLEDKINIKITGTNKQSLADKIRDTLGDIHENFSSLIVKELIPCICEECQSSSPHLYDIDELYTRLEKRKNTVECPISYKMIKVNLIISNFTHKKMSLKEDRLYSKNYRKKVFISYSHKDEKWLIKLQKHLKVLEKIGIDIEVWSDKNIQAGMKWREEIEDSLYSASVAILLISTDFLISDFITNNELPILFEREKKNEIIIIPLIIEDTLIEEFPKISIYQGVNSFNSPLIEQTENEQMKILNNLTRRIKNIIN